jgi:hypothetical protein
VASRYFCAHCDVRVYPYDGFEALTLSPEDGVTGAILLRSRNQQLLAEEPDSPHLWAYCWTCAGWKRCYRLTDADIALMYVRRKGVKLRVESKDAEGRAAELQTARASKRSLP